MLDADTFNPGIHGSFPGGLYVVTLFRVREIGCVQRLAGYWKQSGLGQLGSNWAIVLFACAAVRGCSRDRSSRLRPVRGESIRPVLDPSRAGLASVACRPPQVRSPAEQQVPGWWTTS